MRGAGQRIIQEQACGLLAVVSGDRGANEGGLQPTPDSLTRALGGGTAMCGGGGKGLR